MCPLSKKGNLLRPKIFNWNKKLVIATETSLVTEIFLDKEDAIL